MSKYLKALIAWAIISVIAVSVGLVFGYAFDVGGRTTDRLIGTLDDMINMHCT